MKRILFVIFVLALCAFGLPARIGAQANPPPQSSSAGGADLEKVLDSMDRAAANFHSAQADFFWDQYESVVQEHTLQQGVMSLRKTGADIEMAADVEQPPEQKKYVLFTHGKVQLYQPVIDQVTTYNAGKNREAFQSFLVLGFGGRGHDLAQQFEVHYAGMDKANGIEAAKLELRPKSARVRGMFDRIVLWIDPSRGLSVQQQFFEPSSGNYRLARYNNIKINQKIPNKVFKLETTSKTKFVSPQ